MNSKNYKVFTTLCSILSLASVVACVFIIMNAGQFSTSKLLSAIAALCAVVSGAIYMLFHFGKSGSNALRLFYIFFGICVLFRAVATAKSQHLPEQGILEYILVYGAIIVLAVGKDIGKKASYGIAAFIYVLVTIIFIYCLYVEKGVVFGGTMHDTVSIMLAGIIHFLSSLLALFTVAKYMDKDARGTK